MPHHRVRLLHVERGRRRRFARAFRVARGKSARGFVFEIADEVQEVGVQRNSLEENMQMIRQSQVARCFQVIARQHAKPARKNGQALGHTEFRGEIRHREIFVGGAVLAPVPGALGGEIALQALRTPLRAPGRNRRAPRIPARLDDLCFRADARDCGHHFLNGKIISIAGTLWQRASGFTQALVLHELVRFDKFVVPRPGWRNGRR